MKHYYCYAPRGFANEYTLYWSEEKLENAEECKRMIESRRLQRITRKDALHLAAMAEEYIYPYGVDEVEYYHYTLNDMVAITDRRIVERR